MDSLSLFVSISQNPNWVWIIWRTRIIHARSNFNISSGEPAVVNASAGMWRMWLEEEKRENFSVVCWTKLCRRFSPNITCIIYQKNTGGREMEEVSVWERQRECVYVCERERVCVCMFSPQYNLHHLPENTGKREIWREWVCGRETARYRKAILPQYNHLPENTGGIER